MPWINGKVYAEVVLIDANTGLPYTASSGAGGGGGGGISDILFTDTTGTLFIARDNGTTIAYFKLDGTHYTPSGAVQVSDSLSLAQLHADLAQLHTDLNTNTGSGGTGISQPNGGSGQQGWLSGILDKLRNTIAVVQSGSWTVTTNAGTNTSTAGLAQESGGNLATVATKTTATASALGSTTDAAITSDSNGTNNGFLRGLVKIFSSAWDSSTGSLIVRGMTMVGSAVSNYPIGVAAKAPDGTKAHITVDTAGNTNVNPGMVGGACVSVQTQATGANWSTFGSQTARQLTIVNNTGVSIDITDAANVSANAYSGNNFITVQAGSVMPLFGLSNASGIAVRRNDQSATQVYVQARAEY